MTARVRAGGDHTRRGSLLTGTLLTGTSLIDALRSILSDAVRALVGVDGAGVAVHRGDAGLLIRSSNELAGAVEQVQRRLRRGPGPYALAHDDVVVVDVDGRDRRWPAFVTLLRAFGVRTVLTVPLRLRGRPVGWLQLFSRTARAFSARVVREAELFADASGPRLVPLDDEGWREVGGDPGRVRRDRSTIEGALAVLREVYDDPSSARAHGRLEQAARDLGLDLPLAAARIMAAPPSTPDA